MKKENGGELHLFALQHKVLSFCVWTFCYLLLFVVLSLETEFVHQGQIALNLIDVWSCTLASHTTT